MPCQWIDPGNDTALRKRATIDDPCRTSSVGPGMLPLYPNIRTDRRPSVVATVCAARAIVSPCLARMISAFTRIDASPVGLNAAVAGCCPCIPGIAINRGDIGGIVQRAVSLADA